MKQLDSRGVLLDYVLILSCPVKPPPFKAGRAHGSGPSAKVEQPWASDVLCY